MRQFYVGRFAPVSRRRRHLDAGLTAWNCFLSCVLLGGMCLGGQYAPPPLSESISLFLRYQPPPLSKALMLAEE